MSEGCFSLFCYASHYVAKPTKTHWTTLPIFLLWYEGFNAIQCYARSDVAISMGWMVIKQYVLYNTGRFTVQNRIYCMKYIYIYIYKLDEAYAEYILHWMVKHPISYVIHYTIDVKHLSSIKIIHRIFLFFWRLTFITFISSTATRSQAADPPVTWGGSVQPRYKTVQYNLYWTVFENKKCLIQFSLR